MGEIETTGPQVFEFLQYILSNDVSKVAIGSAQYSTLCQEDGGVIDDLFTYRLGEDRYLMVTNASNHRSDYAWFCEHAGSFDVEVTDRANDFAMLAVQGPKAREIVASLATKTLPVRLKAKQMQVAGADMLVCGTGYTGEDGVELLIEPDKAPAVWDALIEAGVEPIGLGARDTLRLEVCYHLYGSDLSRERTPIEGGLEWACAPETGFIGSDAIRKVIEEGPHEKLVAIAITGQGIPRQDNPVLYEGEKVGVVTSGTMSPSLDLGIGMAYVRADLAEPGTKIQIDVRGKIRDAEVREKPLYKRD